MQKVAKTIFNPSKKSHESQSNIPLNTLFEKSKIIENLGDSDPWGDYVPQYESFNNFEKKKRKNSIILKEILKSAADKENNQNYHNLPDLKRTLPENFIKKSNLSSFTNLEADFEEFPEKTIYDTSPNIFLDISKQICNVENLENLPKPNLLHIQNKKKEKTNKSLEKSKASCLKCEETHYFSNKEINECTFTPKTCQNHQEKRTLNEFLRSQMNFQQNRENKKKKVFFYIF